MKVWWKSQSKSRKMWFALLALVALFVVFVILPAIGWIIGSEAIAATSDAGFCGGCHSMQPFVASNADSIHGGNNPEGVKAECADCHLPHNNSFGYLAAKTATGLHDLRVETFSKTSSIDWRAKTDRREEFVYDSGCLACHADLEEATAVTHQHDTYFDGVTDAKCVTCHADAGHSNLNQYLLENKYRP